MSDSGCVMAVSGRWWRLVSTAVLVVGSAVLAAGQPQSGAGAAREEAEGAAAPVIVDGRVLFVVRGVPSYPAQQRAALIERRIRELGADASVSPDALEIVEEKEVVRIVVGQRPVTSVVDLDARTEGISMRLLAGIQRDKIAQAIQNYRSERRPRELLVRTLYALGFTVAAALLLLALRRLFRWLSPMVERYTHSKMGAARLEVHGIVRGEQLSASLRMALGAVRTVATVIILFCTPSSFLGCSRGPGTPASACWLFCWTRSERWASGFWRGCRAWSSSLCWRWLCAIRCG